MKIIYGQKGSGKTLIIIDSANKSVETARGNVVFITDTKRYSFDLKYQVRFLDTVDFSINTKDGLFGFVSGIMADNADTEYIFIDGITRITGKPLSELKELFDLFIKMESTYDVQFVLTCSSKKEDLPEFISKFVE